MKVETSTVQKILITDIPRLDPVSVLLEDLGPRTGQATITCYNKSWTAWWGGIGERPIREFLLSCNTGYLVQNFGRGDSLDHTIYDLENLVAHARKEIVEQRKAHDLDKDQARELWNDADELSGIEHHQTLFDGRGDVMYKIFGDEWWRCVPEKPNPDYVYLCRIVDAVKEALAVVV